MSALLERMLTVREAARGLGVSTAAVYKLCARGELAHVRLLNTVRIATTALAAVMDGASGVALRQQAAEGEEPHPHGVIHP